MVSGDLRGSHLEGVSWNTFVHLKHQKPDMKDGHDIAATRNVLKRLNQNELKRCEFPAAEVLVLTVGIEVMMMMRMRTIRMMRLMRMRMMRMMLWML